MGAGFVSAGGMKWDDSDVQKCTSAMVSSLIPEVVLICFASACLEITMCLHLRTLLGAVSVVFPHPNRIRTSRREKGS